MPVGISLEEEEEEEGEEEEEEEDEEEKKETTEEEDEEEEKEGKEEEGGTVATTSSMSFLSCFLHTHHLQSLSLLLLYRFPVPRDFRPRYSAALLCEHDNESPTCEH
jgi:hypothetical protein